MAFNIGYVGLCDKNIKHIYTTTDIKQPATRKPLPYKPDFLREQDRVRKDQIRNRRFMQYYPIHDIELPRAPSFRTFPQSEVNDVVSRLLKPASERFDFKYSNLHQQADWRQAYAEKIRRLRDAMTKFGESPRHRQNDEPETGVDLKIDSVDEKDKRVHVKHSKRNRRVRIEDTIGNENKDINNSENVIGEKEKFPSVS